MDAFEIPVLLGLPAKVFVLNENGDTFWLDYTHFGVIRHFVLFRAGLAGAGAVRTLARVFLFPFTLLYLLLYAATVHSRRALRRGHSWTRRKIMPGEEISARPKRFRDAP